MSGIKVQEELSRAGVYVPIVFVTGHGDVAMAVRAMKAGAIDFLTKPFRSQDLLDAVFAALERDSARRKMQQLHSTIREHFESLSAREREVIARVAAGNLNKQIAAELGLSEVTVKVHRANAMRKMHATSLAHLIKMLEHVDTCDSLKVAKLTDGLNSATWRGSRSPGHGLSDVPSQHRRNQLAHLACRHVPQEAIEPKLYHDSTQPFGRCRCDARLDPRERKQRDCFFIACCGLCFFERDEPLLKQSGELLIAVF